MAGSDVQITLGADASAAVQGLSQFNAALTGLAPQVANLASAFDALASKIGSLTNSVGSLANGLKAAGAQGGEGLAALQKEGGGAASAVQSVTGKVTGLVKGAGDLGQGLKAAGVEGAESLIALSDEATPVAAAIGAVVSVVASATDAMAEWAKSAANSSTLSADARDKAQALNTAFGQAQTAFKAAGDAIATSLAPAFTVLVGEAAHLAQGFADDYNKGGLLKTGLDVLAGAVSATFVPILGLAEAVELTWIRISGSWDEMGEKWKLVQEMFGAGVDAIRASFAQLATTIANTVAGDWGAAAKSAMEGVGAAAKAAAGHTAQIAQDMDTIGAHEGAIDQQLAASAERFRKQITGLLGLLKTSPEGGVSTAPNGVPGSPPAASASPPPRVAAPGGPQPAPCECDPSAAAACESDAQALRNQAQAAGQTQRVAANADANAQMGQDNDGLTAAYTSDQAKQVAAAQNAEGAKVQSNDTANRQIREANDKTLKQFQASMNALVKTFADGLVSMAEGSESFGKLMRKVGQQILDDIFRVVLGMVEKWAWGETEKVLATTQAQALLDALGLRGFAAAIARDQAQATSAIAAEKLKTAATQAGATQNMAISGQTALKDITNSAAQAAGGAYKALAGVPFVGPILGAAAAATVFAAVLAFKGLVASAAGGYDIPTGVNPLTQLHAQEMVLPARLANPMRDMLASFGSGSAQSPTGHTFSFGDTHIHGAPNMSPTDFKQALAEHRANVAGAVADALRSGWRPSYRQPVGAL
jgi:hypothetical protein